MTYVSKNWNDFLAGGTPLNAAALNDLEARIAAGIAAGGGGGGVTETLNQLVVATTTITWSASAPAGTAGSAVVTIPPQLPTATAGAYDKPLVVFVRNMSTSAVTIDMHVQVGWNDGSGRFALLTSVAIPAGSVASGDDGGAAFEVDKANLALGGQLSFVNVLAAPGGGQSITVQVWQ